MCCLKLKKCPFSRKTTCALLKAVRWCSYASSGLYFSQNWRNNCHRSLYVLSFGHLQMPWANSQELFSGAEYVVLKTMALLCYAAWCWGKWAEQSFAWRLEKKQLWEDFWSRAFTGVTILPCTFQGNPSKLDIIDVHCLIPRKNIFNRMIPDSWQFLVKYHPFQHSSAQRVWQCFFANRPLTANILMSPKWVNKTNGPLQCSVPKPSWKKRQSCFSSSGESVKLEIAGFTCFKFLHFKQTTLCKLPMQCSYCTLYNDIWYIHTITYVACLPTKILNRKSCYSLMLHRIILLWLNLATWNFTPAVLRLARGTGDSLDVNAAKLLTQICATKEQNVGERGLCILKL